MDCQEGYFITTGAHGSAQQLAAFGSPFLDASSLTPEVRAVITDPGKNGAKTTREWEEFILQAKIAWHAHQESAQRDSQGIREGLNKDNASSMSGVYLPDEPANFMFTEPQEFGNLEFTHQKSHHVPYYIAILLNHLGMFNLGIISTFFCWVL